MAVIAFSYFIMVQSMYSEVSDQHQYAEGDICFSII